MNPQLRARLESRYAPFEIRGAQTTDFSSLLAACIEWLRHFEEQGGVHLFWIWEIVDRYLLVDQPVNRYLLDRPADMYPPMASGDPGWIIRGACRGTPDVQCWQALESLAACVASAAGTAHKGVWLSFEGQLRQYSVSAAEE